MTDKELLTLAAKAAGELTPNWYGNEAYLDGLLSKWNPLTDDGCALRLAVRLNLIVGIYDSYADVCHTFIRGNESDVPDDETVWFSSVNNDPYAATRRAIVRAAAEIGRGME